MASFFLSSYTLQLRRMTNCCDSFTRDCHVTKSFTRLIKTNYTRVGERTRELGSEDSFLVEKSKFIYRLKSFALFCCEHKEGTAKFVGSQLL